MKMRWLILLCCSLLLEYVLSETQSLENLLRTPQFIIVSQFQCHTTFEFNRPGKQCVEAAALAVTAFNSPLSLQLPCDHPMHVHLIKHYNKLLPPRLLYVSAGRYGKAIVFTEDIQLRPTINGTMYEQKLHEIDSEGFATIDYAMDQITATLYDWESQQLVILVKHYQRRLCIVFTIAKPYENSLEHHFTLNRISRFETHPDTHNRQHWSIDPYTRMVYYRRLEQGQSVVYSLAFSRLALSLRDGIPGSAVFTVPDHMFQHSSQVTGGLFISSDTGFSFHEVFMKNVHDAAVRGIRCKSALIANGTRPIFKPSRTPFIVIRDEDYCILRAIRDDVANVTEEVENCALERQTWLKANAFTEFHESLPEREDDFWMKWLIVACLLLLAVLLLLGLYTCLLRKAYYEEDVGTAGVYQKPDMLPRYYYPVNGVMGQQLDDTVDTWRH